MPAEHTVVSKGQSLYKENSKVIQDCQVCLFFINTIFFFFFFLNHAVLSSLFYTSCSDNFTPTRNKKSQISTYRRLQPVTGFCPRTSRRWRDQNEKRHQPCLPAERAPRTARRYLATAAPSPFILAAGAARSDWNGGKVFFKGVARRAGSCFGHSSEDRRRRQQRSGAYDRRARVHVDALVRLSSEFDNSAWDTYAIGIRISFLFMYVWPGTLGPRGF